MKPKETGTDDRTPFLSTSRRSADARGSTSRPAPLPRAIRPIGRRCCAQLGGQPDLNPDGLLTRSHSEYAETDDLLEIIQENLVAERIAIESYAEIIRYLGDDDPTSRRMMEEILATEEEHAEDLRNLIQALGRKGPA